MKRAHCSCLTASHHVHEYESSRAWFTMTACSGSIIILRLCRRMCSLNFVIAITKIRKMKMTKIKTTKQRFYEKTGLDWQWIGYKNNRGYGTLYVDGKHKYAHRISYQIHIGKIPNGMCVLHSCDNPACVNPEHLHLGTQKINAYEREIRNRGNHVRGEKNGRSKFTIKQILEIRKKSQKGISNAELAKEYSVVNSTIHFIKTKKHWKHVK